MKKLLLSLAMVGLAVSTFAQGILTTNITGGAGMFLLSTNRIRVYSIEVTTTNAYNFKFWDNDNTTQTSASTGFWGTNFVSGAYVSRSSYPTTYVNSYINTQNFTNWYTNYGTWTATVTNAAATNAMSPLYQISTSGAETRLNYVDLIFTRGIVCLPSGNGTITLYYRYEP